MSRAGLWWVCGALVAAYGTAPSLLAGCTSDQFIPMPDGGLDSGVDSAGPTDGSLSDAPQVTCDGGLASCNGQCVDTSTDPNNCGGCNVVCNTQCTGGTCQLIGGGCDASVPPVGDFACIAVDATNVYWGTGQVASSGGAVWKVPINGGCPTILIGSQDRPHGIATDGTNVYYANYGASSNIGAIYSIPVAGGSPTPLALTQASPLDVAVDGTNVYWTDSGDGSVWKSNKSGTPTPVKLANGAGQGHAQYLRVDAANVYFTDHSSGVVNRVPIAGGSVTAMTTTGISGVGHLAIDAQNVYFGSNGPPATIQTVGLTQTNTAPSQVLGGIASIAGIATDATNLWFAVPTNVQPWQANTGEIHRATVAGKNDVTLSSKQNGPDCVVVDATSVYWIDTGGGMIAKTAK